MTQIAEKDRWNRNPGNGISLRPAVAEDEKFLFDLYAGTRAEELDAWGWDDAQRQSFLELQFRSRRAHFEAYPGKDHRIITWDGRPIGRLFLAHLEQEIIIVDIALIPERRGRGIGAELIGQVLEQAAQSGKSVQLHVEKSNRAERLYRRLGFEIAADAGMYWRMILPFRSPGDKKQRR